MTIAEPDLASIRRRSVLETAERQGLLAGERGPIGARIRKALLQGAKERSGLSSTTDVIEYALARVALEDGFIQALFAVEGKISPDVDLEF
jgi:hypothetical protein